jgi:hypothetical protein
VRGLIDWQGVLMGVLLVSLMGCRTPMGTIPPPMGNVVYSDLDSLHGKITDTYKDGTKKVRNYNVESVIHVTWSSGDIYASPRFWTWDPLGGMDFSSGKFSWFAGAKYFSVMSFGLHFGVDGNSVIPLGIDWKRGAVVYGPQLAMPYLALLKGQTVNAVPSFLAAFQF